jgi:hypothetical protein
MRLLTEVPFMVYGTHGFGPDNGEMKGGFYNGYLVKDVFAWGASYAPQLHSIFIYMLTPTKHEHDSWNIADFSATRCTIAFTTRQYAIHINTAQTISAMANEQNNLVSPTTPKLFWTR